MCTHKRYIGNATPLILTANFLRFRLLLAKISTYLHRLNMLLAAHAEKSILIMINYAKWDCYFALYICANEYIPISLSLSMYFI